MRRAPLGWVCLLVGLSGTGCRNAAEPEAPRSEPPLEITPSQAVVQDSIPDRYIVVLKDDVRDVVSEGRRELQLHGGRMHLAYGRALKGYSATLSPKAVAALRRHPNVKYIEPDRLAPGRLRVRACGRA